MRKIALLGFLPFFLYSFPVSAKYPGDKFTSFAGFELGTVNLSEIQNNLGKAKVVETGDAGDYTASICYIVPTGVVLFLAGEMDGPNHDLGGFGFARETDRQPCAKWPKSLAIPSLNLKGIRLGLSQKEFRSVVGTPVRLDGQKAYAAFESKRKMTKKEISRLPKDIQSEIKTGKLQDSVDVFVSLNATFSNGVLKELRVWKSETF
jgi:hypothetical protein